MYVIWIGDGYESVRVTYCGKQLVTLYIACLESCHQYSPIF